MLFRSPLYRAGSRNGLNQRAVSICNASTIQNKPGRINNNPLDSNRPATLANVLNLAYIAPTHLRFSPKNQAGVIAFHCPVEQALGYFFVALNSRTHHRNAKVIAQRFFVDPHRIGDLFKRHTKAGHSHNFAPNRGREL